MSPIKSLSARFEVPTWLVAGAIYGGWLGVTALYGTLPWWCLLAAGGWLLAWHGSLQHEAIHGHPTRSARVNALVAGLPLGLWLPYGIYRELHVAHHRCPDITDPLDDPESFYVTAAAWRSAGPIGRALLRAHATLLGRLLLGPPLAVSRLLANEVGLLWRGDRRHLRHWALHAAGLIPVLLWLTLVAGIPLWAYLLLFVYPGLALTLLRSYAEHRVAPERSHRTAIIEAGAPFGLLFLHNNLHAVHHARPHLPWYQIPGWYRAHQDRVLEKNGGYLVPGYLPLIRRWGLRAHQPPVYPTGEEHHGRRAAAR